MKKLIHFFKGDWFLLCSKYATNLFGTECFLWRRRSAAQTDNNRNILTTMKKYTRIYLYIPFGYNSRRESVKNAAIDDASQALSTATFTK